MIQTSNKSRIPCSEHPNEQITNYCCNLHCLRPLCPDCVQVHTKSHSKQEIESWKNCLNNTIKQLKNTHYRLKDIQSRLGHHKGGRTIQAIQQEAIRKLDSLRRQMHQLVDEVFDHHERQVRNIIRNQFRSNPIDISKLRVAIQEIEKLMMKLSSNNTVIPALKKSILLDHQALIGHFEQEFRNAPQQVIRDEFFLNIDQDDITKIRRQLERLINYDSTQVVSKPYTQYPQHEDLLSLPKESVYQKGLVISKEDYFYETNSKYLHFFIPGSTHLKLLHLTQLNNKPVNWKTIKLSMTGTLPNFFKSIITPHGDIFLTGGTSNQTKKKQTSILRFNPQRNSLEYVADMITPRSSHSICYMNGNIFLIGGFKSDDEAAKECEIYNVQTRKCRPIGSLCYPSANCCVSAFNNQYLFKFGGVLSFGQPSHVIEMYSIKENSWITIDPDLQRYTERIWISSYSAAVQINTNEIFIFGGYSDAESQVASTMSYTLYIERKGSQNVFSLRNIGVYPLPIAEGFWDNNPIVAGNQIMSLQNVQDADQQSASVDERRILIFNGKRWFVA